MPPKKSPPVPRVPLFSKTILRLQKGSVFMEGFGFMGDFGDLGTQPFRGSFAIGDTYSTNALATPAGLRATAALPALTICLPPLLTAFPPLYACFDA